MCGIVGYAGNIETACGKPLEVCLQGLERLEYRGYDSAGVALTAPGVDMVVVRKKAGRLKNLGEDIERKPMPLATVGTNSWDTGCTEVASLAARIGPRIKTISSMAASMA